MRTQSLPKGLPFTLKPIQKSVGQPGWSNFLRPIDESMPQHSFQCQCLMCKAYDHKKFKQALGIQTLSINNKIRSRVTTSNSSRQLMAENNYHWILKHLMIPQHKIATTGLNINITETLFFKDGQASEFFLSKELGDPTIKRVGKEKLTNTYIQKVMSERRRKYKDYIRIKTGRKKVQPKKKPLFGQKQVKKQIKDATLIRYTDGYEQLLTQNEFLSMFLRRKQDPLWRQITSIKNFIDITNPQDKKSSYIVTKYKKGKIQYQQLFNRAKLLMKIYGQYVTPEQPNYITPKQQQQFSKKLQSESIQTYAQYLTYQIVNYIEYFYDEQITNLVIGLYFDEIDNVFINEVYKLEVKSLIKFEWTNEIYRKRMDQDQIKILQTKAINNRGQAQNGANEIIKVMFTAYEQMRNKFGLNAEDKDDQEQVANNNFFKTLHPQFKHNISDILKDPNLTLSQFKKNYLGHRNQKKPIIKQFTSNMIKTIHLTSPRLRRSVPHDYIQSPGKHNHSTLPSSSRKIDSFELSPLKKNSLRQMYQTLPLQSPKQ